MLLGTYLGFAGLGGAFFVVSQYARELPKRLDKVLDYAPARATLVYSSDGELIGEFFLEKRVVVPLTRIPEVTKQAFLSAEDRRFYAHTGFDPLGIARAAWANYVGGGVRQGASTITQQVARMLLLTQEKTFSRKMKEIILSVRVERELSKDQILSIYMNHAYLGHGAYGVQAAAENYFGKDVEHLTVGESAILAGLPKAPTKFSPFVNYTRAKERQGYVLGRMISDKVISPEEYADGMAEPLAFVSREQPLNYVAAPYFVEHIRRWATQTYGNTDVFHGGLRIYTSLDMRAQRAAEAAVQDGMRRLDDDLGFRGPVGRMEGPGADAFVEGPPRPYLAIEDVESAYVGGTLVPGSPYLGLVTDVNTKKQTVTLDLGPISVPMTKDQGRRLVRWRGPRGRSLSPGDLIPVTLQGPPDAQEAHLAQRPQVQAAFVSIEPHTGFVRALVGGLDYRQSQFNRATQARRQAGSSIKPFIYATALEHGFHHLTVLPDAPVAVRTLTGVWSPKNYTREYLGPVTLRTALAKSINTVSVRLVVATGVSDLIKMMRRVGIESDVPRHISVALGTNDVTLLEMTAGYASFPSGGEKIRPRFVTQVSTDEGKVLYDVVNEPRNLQAMSPAIAYLMTDLLRTVVQRGTARKAQALGRPAAGKTGTGSQYRDAWFVGFTADMVAGVWVGRDDFTPIGPNTTGGSASLPIWMQYMVAAHPPGPPNEFQVPPDITFVRADEMTGLAAAPGASQARWVPFARGTVPERFTGAVDGQRFSTSPGFRREPAPDALDASELIESP